MRTGQMDGKLDMVAYRMALSSQYPPRTPSQFDKLVRQSLRQSLVAMAVGNSAFVAAAELDRLLRLSGETRDVELVVLPPAPEDTAAVTDDDAKARYEAHTADFMRPERVGIEYVEVTAQQVPEPAPADEA